LKDVAPIEVGKQATNHSMPKEKQKVRSTKEKQQAHEAALPEADRLSQE
jgi:hypothetical protein